VSLPRGQASEREHLQVAAVAAATRVSQELLVSQAGLAGLTGLAILASLASLTSLANMASLVILVG
jgi:hypothetical protein